MVKTVSSALNDHLQGEVTTLATAWIIDRQDGQTFRFTTNSEDVTANFGIGEGTQTYLASAGYTRTNIQNNPELTVNNMDVTGLFDDESITEDDLRAGLFDGADVRIFFFNHQDTSQGVIKMLRGVLGEVIVTPNGFFTVELRSLENFATKKISELYSKDCRADLGDQRCRLPIRPDVRLSNTAYSDPFTPPKTPGTFVRVSNDLAQTVLVVPADDFTADDKSPIKSVPSIGSQAQVQEVVKKFGKGALEFIPSGSVDPSNAFVAYADSTAYTIGSGEFNIEGWVRFKSIGASLQTIASHWSSSSQRSWALSADNSQLVLSFSTDGGAGTVVTVSGAFSFAADTWYFVTASRDSSNDIRLFVDGTQVGSTVNNNATFHDSTEPLRIGKIRDPGGDDSPLNGFVDDLDFKVRAVRTANFSVPTTAAKHVENLTAEDFDDRIYQLDTDGTTALVQPTFNTTIDATTNDGTAVWSAKQAFTRFAEVVAVDSSEPRRKFKVTQLTPNSGSGNSGRDFFPDDVMNFGGCTFESGNNKGRTIEIKDFVADDGVTIEQEISLYLDAPFDVVVGDKLAVFRGCDKRFPTCRDDFMNEENFVGEPYVRGQDYLGQYPDAQTS